MASEIASLSNIEAQNHNEPKSITFFGWLLRLCIIVGLVSIIFGAGIAVGWAIWADEKVCVEKFNWGVLAKLTPLGTHGELD